MRWPWSRKRTRESEATKAREAAERRLAHTKAQTPHYEALGEELRRIRRENHLTELVLNIPRRRHP